MVSFKLGTCRFVGEPPLSTALFLCLNCSLQSTVKSHILVGIKIGGWVPNGHCKKYWFGGSATWFLRARNCFNFAVVKAAAKLPK